MRIFFVLFVLFIQHPSFAQCNRIYDLSTLDDALRKEIYAVERECLEQGMTENGAVHLMAQLAERAKIDPEVKTDVAAIRAMLARLRSGEIQTAEEIKQLANLLSKYDSQFLFAFHLTYLPALAKILEGDASSNNEPYMRPSGKVYGGHAIYVSEQPINGKQSLATRLVGDQLSQADVTIIFQGEAANVFKAPSRMKSIFTLNIPELVRSFSGTKSLSFKRVVFKKYRVLDEGKTVVVEEVELRDVPFRERIKGWMSNMYELTYLWLAGTTAAGAAVKIFAPVVAN